MTCLEIERMTELPDCILGVMSVLKNGKVVYTCSTLELPWRVNKRQISCIPPGEYNVVRRSSPKYGDHFLVQDVPDRDMILIHLGNTYQDTKGCIIVGEHQADINSDGIPDVTGSRKAMNRLNELIEDKAVLIINDNAM